MARKKLEQSEELETSRCPRCGEVAHEANDNCDTQG